MQPEPTFNVAPPTEAPFVVDGSDFSLEERLASPDATPIPGHLALVRSRGTVGPNLRTDAAEVIRSSGRTTAALAFLAIDPKDEELVDALVARRMATKKSRPITR